MTRENPLVEMTETHLICDHQTLQLVNRLKDENVLLLHRVLHDHEAVWPTVNWGHTHASEGAS